MFFIRVYDLIYICIYSLIPENAILGRKEGSATFHAVLIFFFYLIVLLWVVFFWLNLKELNLYWNISLLVVFITQYFFNRVYFLNEEKQKRLVKKYSSFKKWKLKLLGVLIILFCYFFFMISATIVSESRRQSALDQSQTCLRPLSEARYLPEQMRQSRLAISFPKSLISLNLGGI